MVFARLLAVLLTVMFSVLSACGSTGITAPPATINGPALIFFYTDN